MGSSVVNALSKALEIKISRGGAVHRDAYQCGVPVVDLVNGLLPTIGKTKETGTEINFLPDDEIFEKTYRSIIGFETSIDKSAVNV